MNDGDQVNQFLSMTASEEEVAIAEMNLLVWGSSESNVARGCERISLTRKLSFVRRLFENTDVD